MIRCLFCKSPCSVVNGQVSRERITDEFITPDFTSTSLKSDSHPDLLLTFEETPPLISEHLRAIFVLRNVLKVGRERLYQFFRQDDGQPQLESWVNICLQCEESVHQFHKTQCQLSKLEKKLVLIEAELKTKIYKTKDCVDAEGCWTMWGQIRSEVLINENDMSLENLTRLRKYHCRCRLCPFRGANNAHLKTHLLAHEPGSGATPCTFCGWYTLLSKGINIFKLVITTELPLQLP